jgi:hypothetical protein
VTEMSLICNGLPCEGYVALWVEIDNEYHVVDMEATTGEGCVLVRTIAAQHETSPGKDSQVPSLRPMKDTLPRGSLVWVTARHS